MIVQQEVSATRKADSVEALARACPTPALLISRQQIRRNLDRLREALPGVELFYAVKANSHPAVVETVAAAGLGFELSSIGELDLVSAAEVDGSGLVSFNPVKTTAFLEAAHAAGLRVVAADSADELEKIARHAPESRVTIRVTVDNSGSEWPLARKFGVGPDQAGRLLDRATELGLEAAGLTFHVGSQCLDVASWSRALEVCAAAWRAARRVPERPPLISLGGGFPVQHIKPLPELRAIGRHLIETSHRLFGPEVQLTAEPGRAVVGDAAHLVTTVIGVAEREGGRWIHLDAGVFNAFMESIDGFRYEVRPIDPRGGPPRPAILAGPSCDSVDVISHNTPLPATIRTSNRLIFANAGAYTLSYASHFNGFPPPEVVLID
ncbi:MAG TPA: type III PLP-dependent enzyme [Dehalococcoidia bacterium]|nr:type III PLP-dependent enzyme [Dehalococcoidia bacterium]